MVQSPSLPIPSIRVNQQMSGEDQQRRGGCSNDCSSVAESGVVSNSAGKPSGRTNAATRISEHPKKLGRHASSPSHQGPSSSGRLAHIRQNFSTRGFSEGVIGMLNRSWRNSTESAYTSAWRRWDCWCTTRNIHPLSAPLKEILEFLLKEFDSGKQYRTLNTIRSAISMTHDEIDGTRVGQHEVVSCFMKGVFNSRPPAPRYTSTWDVDVVLKFLGSLPENTSLPLPMLTHKLAMLLALANANRCSDLAALDLQFCSMQSDGAKFMIPGLTKTRRTGPPKEAFFAYYSQNKKLCPVSTLIVYRQRTKDLRPSGNQGRLFISVRRPHHPVKSATIGHWLKKVMEQSGIDTTIFSAHSTRGAATSKAVSAGVSIPEILKAADWSTPSTFSRFYHRPVISDSKFGQVVLSGKL